MTRLDGGAATDNPALAGGFISDGLELDTVDIGNPNVFGVTIGCSAATTGLIAVAAVYENVNTDTPVTDFLQTTLGDPNDSIGPIDIGFNGAAVGAVLANINNSAQYVFDAPAVIRQSIQTGTSNNRLARLADALGGASAFSFDLSSLPGSSTEHAWAAALAAGAASYAPSDSVSFIAAGTATTVNTPTTTITIPLPAGFAAGDLLICVVHHDENNGALGFNAESGWVRVGYENGQNGQTVFMKFAAGGDSDPTFDSAGTGAQGLVGISVAYSNVAAVAWYEAAGIENVAGPITFTPARSLHVDGGMAVAIGASGFYQPISMPTANGYTQRAIASKSSDGGVFIADKAVPTAGNPGMPSLTANAFDFISLGLLYLLPT